MNARLRNLGRDLHSRVKEFFDHPLEADATPLELLQVALEQLERYVQPAGRGRRTFPYNRVTVRISQHGVDETAVQAVFAGLIPRLHGRLHELNCDAPEAIAAEVVVTPAPADASGAAVTVACVNDAETRPAPAPAPSRPPLRITVLKGQCAETEYLFDEPVIAIGRTAEPSDALGLVRYNHVAFLEARDGITETVGRAHARLQFEPGSRHYVLFNESGSNPTSIVRNGRTIRVAPNDPRGVRVQSGDQVQLGRAALRLTLDPAVATAIGGPPEV